MLGKLKSLFGDAAPAGGVRAPTPPPPNTEPWELPFDGVATTADVLHCFRLLLGRHPHREEWPGHSGRAGEPLANLVAAYLGSLEFAQRRLLAPDRSNAPTVAAIQGFRIHIAADDLIIGPAVLADLYEPDVTAVFRRLLRPGMNVIDVGANMGYFSLLSAVLVGPGGHVLAVEPNPGNACLLEASRRLNGFAQITIAQVAAGRETGLLVLHAAQSNGTTSACPDDLDALLKSRTVPSIRLDDLVPLERPTALIKLDAEGAEYMALLGAEGLLARDRPAIVSEFGPDMMPGISGVSGEDYLRWLIARGYRIGVIQRDGSNTPFGTDPAPILAEYRASGSDHVDILALPD